MREDVGEEEPMNVSINVNKIIVAWEKERKKWFRIEKIREIKKQ